MSGLGEAAAQQNTSVKSALDAGIDVVSNFQVVEFQLYVRQILPLDGYAFWVRADLVGGAGIGLFSIGVSAIGSPPGVGMVLKAEGDLHYSSVGTQDEATSYSINKVIFTSKEAVNDLDRISPNTMYIGTIDDIRFSFSTRGYFQENAGVYHYVGDAVYPDLETQIIDDPSQLDLQNVIVSNSLPIWLAMNSYMPQAWEAFGNFLPLYPSFLVPDNLPPPYAAVHITPDSTRAMASFPTLSPTYSHDQLVTERVKITLYGQRNYNAQDFVDFVTQQSVNTDSFGILNMPVLRDEKRTQNELNAIAMKKTIEFEISYLQSSVRNIARQLILSAIPAYFSQPV